MSAPSSFDSSETALLDSFVFMDIPGLGFDDVQQAPEGEQQQEQQGAKRRRRQSSGSGTTKRTRRKCSHEGCDNGVVQGGVCKRHGAKQRICKVEGCKNPVKQAGLCSAHGPPRKVCEVEGCEKGAVRGGVCKRHDKEMQRIIPGFPPVCLPVRNPEEPIRERQGSSTLI